MYKYIYARTYIKNGSKKMVYIDIAFFVIIALWMLLGLWRGIAKTTKGLFWAVAVVLCALLILGMTFDLVRTTSVFDTIETQISQSAEGWGEAFTSPIYLDEEGNYYINSPDTPLESSGGIQGIFAKFLATRFINSQNSGSSLVGIAATMLTSLIAALILFVGYSIGLGLVGFILRKATKGMHKSENKVVNALDRVFGALIGAALALVFLLVVLAILKSINVEEVTAYINESTVCKYFFDSNPVSKVFAEIFGV